MKSVPVGAVVSALKDDFNIEMDIYQAARHAAKALELMGMIAMHKEIARGLVDNYCLKLPPEVVKISSVICTSKPIDPTWTYEIQDITHPPQIVFRSTETEASLTTTTPLVLNNHVPSQHYGYIPYVWECPYVKFNETKIEVMIEYTTMTLDEQGFPQIPETALDGCIHWAVFKHMQPLFMLGKVAPAIFSEVTRWKNQKLNQSRTATMMRGLNNNTKNRILDILTSFDRKRVNIDA